MDASQNSSQDSSQADALVDPQDWDSYWDSKKGSGGVLYDVVAEFYRKFLIRPSLNHFIKKYFAPQAEVLHAGCGSGQVDKEIRNYLKITALDISKNALEIYQRENQGACRIVHGSIFALPIESNSLDGIYNLGVMEHFDPVEIASILQEFHRVLKPQGRMVIFWPPEFGASVIFLKSLKATLELVRGKGVKFHPDEITRVQSREHVSEIFRQSGFSVLEYAFGPRDAFTQVMIAVEKARENLSPSA